LEYQAFPKRHSTAINRNGKHAESKELPVQVVTSVKLPGTRNLVTSFLSVSKTSPWRKPVRGDNQHVATHGEW
jgi:hypothetical protein